MSPKREHQLQSFISRIYSQVLGLLQVVRAHFQDFDIEVCRTSVLTLRKMER
jgi:hypothetical protein